MGVFVPSIVIGSIVFAGSTAVNFTLHKARGKDSINLKNVAQAKYVALPILMTLSIMLGSVIFGGIITGFSSVVVVSQTIDFLFATLSFASFASIASSYITYISI